MRSVKVPTLNLLHILTQAHTSKHRREVGAKYQETARLRAEASHKQAEAMELNAQAQTLELEALRLMASDRSRMNRMETADRVYSLERSTDTLEKNAESFREQARQWEQIAKDMGENVERFDKFKNPKNVKP